MEYLYCVLIGYLIGSINPSYIIGKFKGYDIRKKGSGNAGASNALILFGKLVGLAVALFDILKAFFALLIVINLFPNLQYAFAVTSVAIIIGHIYPFYMKFKGGKGLACLAGIVLFFDWRVFLIMLAIEIVIALVTDYICFVPMTGSLAFPFIYGFMTGDLWGALILGIITVIIMIRHIENIKKILTGTEVHLSYLWKPDAEMNRMKRNMPEDVETVEDRFLRNKDSLE